MSTPKHSVVLIILLLCPVLTVGQNNGTDGGTKSPRFMVQLLSGYKLELFPSLDAAGGRIISPAGFTIEYGAGELMFKEADSVPSKQVLWKSHQVINGHPLTCVYKRTGEFIATFEDMPVTNFKARIKGNQDLAETLLTILTFDPKNGYPVDPAAVKQSNRQKDKN